MRVWDTDAEERGEVWDVSKGKGRVVRPLSEVEKWNLRRNIAKAVADGTEVRMTTVQAEAVKEAMGIDIREMGVVVTDEVDLDARLVCMRTTRRPSQTLIEVWGEPGRGHCGTCGAEVWVDERSEQRIPIICGECHEEERKLMGADVKGVH